MYRSSQSVLPFASLNIDGLLTEYFIETLSISRESRRNRGFVATIPIRSNICSHVSSSHSSIIYVIRTLQACHQFTEIFHHFVNSCSQLISVFKDTVTEQLSKYHPASQIIAACLWSQNISLSPTAQPLQIKITWSALLRAHGHINELTCRNKVVEITQYNIMRVQTNDCSLQRWNSQRDWSK